MRFGWPSAGPLLGIQTVAGLALVSLATMSSIFSKLAVTDRTKAVLRAIALGLV